MKDRMDPRQSHVAEEADEDSASGQRMIGEATLANMKLLESLATVSYRPPLERFENPVSHVIVFISIAFAVCGASLGIEDALLILTAVLIVLKLRTALRKSRKIKHGLFTNSALIVVPHDHLVSHIESIGPHHLAPAGIVSIVALKALPGQAPGAVEGIEVSINDLLRVVVKPSYQAMRLVILVERRVFKRTITPCGNLGRSMAILIMGEARFFHEFTTRVMHYFSRPSARLVVAIYKT